MPVSVPTFIKQAWAAVGTKFTIPDNANPTTGRAGWDQGFSPINLTPVAAGGIPPFGQDMNGVLYDITSAIQYIQAGRSFPYNQDFADAVGGYGKGSLVSLETDLSVVYKSKVDNNLTPPPSANWDVSGDVAQATESIAGIAKISTKEKALDGINDDSIITPKKLSLVLSGVAVNERQTVITGPVGSDGLASFLPTTSTSLSLTSQGIDSSSPILVTSANGYSGKLSNNSIGIATSNLTWSGLAANATNYLFVDIAADGSLTPVHSTLAPIYQFGGARSAVDGQFVFNYGDMKSATVGNGSMAEPKQRVCIGEATTNATVVVSTVSYAYQGRTVIETSQLVNNSVLSNNHRIGVLPVVNYALRCITAIAGYSVGQEIPRWLDGVTGVADSTVGVSVDKTVVRGLVGGSNISVNNFSTGAVTTAAVSSFTLIFRVSRGW